MGYCEWADINELYKTYHDKEWGVPVHDDRKMFEYLILECMQCGLSWDLILKKRDVFRKCFDDFDYDRIAEYDDKDVERILNTENMIRSVRKIEAVINNDYTRIDYHYSKSSFDEGCHHLLIDSVEIAKPSVDYEDRDFTSIPHLNAYPVIDISECGSCFKKKTKNFRI